VEKARLAKASSERCYGVQIATNTIDEGVAAAEAAAAAGATWIDINCGCPIHGMQLLHSQCGSLPVGVLVLAHVWEAYVSGAPCSW
jgi:tRNA-dihydrouridine synthase